MSDAPLNTQTNIDPNEIIASYSNQLRDVMQANIIQSVVITTERAAAAQVAQELAEARKRIAELELEINKPQVTMPRLKPVKQDADFPE